ncbi:MAG: transporter substrate-binding domain-containing protein, partial [Treponema sp.]|nr:transporter substrate-binding domain-containing protein [Treponema sp.]
MNKIGQTARSLLTVVLSVILILTLLSGCGEEVSEKNGLSMENISFRDIPGITEDEISAVEALRERYSAFTYGMLVSTEAFPNQDDEIRGYTALLCEWLTELFGIHFVPKLYSWDGLLEGLGSGAIDFTGELTANRERRESYYMTDAIAGRMVDYYRIAGSAPLSEIAASRPPRYVFFESTTTINDVLSSFDDDTSYETFFVRDFDRVYSMLKSGEADAFFSEENNIAAFDEYGDVVGRHFFPPIISPVSMSTQNSELRPIIDLVQKVLQNGGSTFLVELYNRGKSEYLQHTLFRKLTEEERNYINHNPVIYYVTQYNNYPMSFYNGHIKQWQGIAFELLSKIEALTGFTFRLAHDDVFISSPYLLAMVEYGQAAFVTELIRTKERVGRFIWLDTTLATEFLTLVSPSEQRSFGLSEIKNLTIGVIRNTAQTETFNRWFPNHEKTVEYDDTKEAFLAMRRGDVDLVMTSTSNLLVMTNYLELTGFKANIIFDDTVQESTFGFGTDEDILRSIIDKALGLINTKAISDDWKNRTFDHRYKLIEAQRPWLIGAIVLSLIILGLLSVLFIRSRYAGKRLEKLVKIRTEELELQTSTLNTMIDSLPDIVFCKDLNTNYTRYNKVMADYFGVCDKTLVGKGDVDGLGFPVDLVEQIHTVDRTIMRENKQMVFEEWVP